MWLASIGSFVLLIWFIIKIVKQKCCQTKITNINNRKDLDIVLSLYIFIIKFTDKHLTLEKKFIHD